MKKVFIIIFGVLMSINSFAQKKISWEGQVGLNVSEYNTTGYNSRVGFHVGVRGQLDIPSLFNGAYANAGAFLSLKGASLDMGDVMSGKSSAYYLEIPIHFGYKHTLNDKFSIFGEFGPYFAFGLFGKVNSEVMDIDIDDYYDVSTSSVSESHNTFDEFKRFDFGLGLRVGVELYKKYTFSIGYDFGLINIWDKNWLNDEYDDEENLSPVGNVKNRNLTITLGYKF